MAGYRQGAPHGMATEDRLVEDLRGIFDEARRSSGQVQAEALLAVAPVVLKASDSERGVAYMRDRLTPESYRAICRAIGDELDRLNAEIDRLKRFEKIAGVVESAAPLRLVYEPNNPAANADGYVEMPNVNVVEELVTMIATQRAYELNSKAISTSDQMLQRLSQL